MGTFIAIKIGNTIRILLEKLNFCFHVHYQLLKHRWQKEGAKGLKPPSFYVRLLHRINFFTIENFPVS